MIIQISSAASMPLDPTAASRPRRERLGTCTSPPSVSPNAPALTIQHLAQHPRESEESLPSPSKPSPAHQADSPTITLGASEIDNIGCPCDRDRDGHPLMRGLERQAADCDHVVMSSGRSAARRVQLGADARPRHRRSHPHRRPRTSPVQPSSQHPTACHRLHRSRVFARSRVASPPHHRLRARDPGQSICSRPGLVAANRRAGR